MFSKEQIDIIYNAFESFPVPERGGNGFIRLAVLILREREGIDSPHFRLMDGIFGGVWRWGRDNKQLTAWAKYYLEKLIPPTSDVITNFLSDFELAELEEFGGIEGFLNVRPEEFVEFEESTVNMEYSCKWCDNCGAKIFHR